MVRWCGLEWRPAGECGSECVCVCLSKEKRKKMKERKERAGQKKEERWVKMCGGVWGLVGAHVVHKKKKADSYLFFFFF